MIRAAYLASFFPTLSETFVFREINALRAQGAEIFCFSIHRPQPQALPADAQHLRAETTYLWPVRIAPFLFAIIKFAAGRPRRFFTTLALFLKRAPRDARGVKRFVLHFLEGAYFAHLCERRRVEYIHAHFANGPSSVALAASALSGIPFGFTSHAQDIYADPLLLDLKIAKAQNALTISEYNRRHLVENYCPMQPERVQLQRVSVDLTHFQPGPKSSSAAPLILTIGRLVPKKGFIHLIRACELLAQAGVNFRCQIIGEGPERAALQAAIDASGLQERVTLLGAQTDVKKFLQQAELFVMPSVVDATGDRDGIPTVLMEAMAMQVPVISTLLSGIPELIQHERNGLLVAPENSTALAEAMLRLLNDDKLSRTLAAAGRRYIETQHNLETNTRCLLQRMLTATRHSNLNTRRENDMSWKYSIISPVRNEAKYLARTIQSVTQQTRLPLEWVIIDDGSTDDTLAIADAAAKKFPWIKVHSRQDRGFRAPGHGVVEAFNEGFVNLTKWNFDFVCKLDGDLEFGADYFPRLLQMFDANPRLGMASGTTYVQSADGKLVQEKVTPGFVLGCMKLYRRACFEDIGGLVPHLGWDTIDVYRARMRGWETVTRPELKVIHLRQMGTEKGIVWGKMKTGNGDYYYGSHPLFVAARCVYRMFERPYGLIGLSIGMGYLQSWWRNEARINDPAFIKFLRADQLARLGRSVLPWKSRPSLAR